MPLEKTKSEWRARVEDPGQCKKDSYYQAWPSKEDGGSHYPYNSKGIRALGCRRKSDDKSMIQSVRFSTKKNYSWTASKIKKWIKSHGYTLKMLLKMYSLKDEPMSKMSEHMVYITSTEEFGIKAEKAKDGRRLITGVISSDQVDKHGEIVDPAAVINSKDAYMEFPTIRMMHEANQVGRALDLWREGNKVWAEVEIFDDEDKIWNRIQKGYLRAFSIGFRVINYKEYCPNGLDEQCYIMFTEIMLVEVSLVDSPANTDAVFQMKEQLKEIGGDSLVNKLIIKVENKDKETTSNIGDGVEENIENTKGETMEKETEMGTEEELPVTEPVEEETVEPVIEETEEVEEEFVADPEETESDPVNTEDKETEEEVEEEFVPAEEDNKDAEKETEDKKEDVEKTKAEMTLIKDDIKSLKDAVNEIKEAVEGLLDKKVSKIKELMEENEKLEKKLEEKKLPRRNSFKDKEDIHDGTANKEENLKVGREIAVQQIERIANKRLVKRR